VLQPEFEPGYRIERGEKEEKTENKELK